MGGGQAHQGHGSRNGKRVGSYYDTASVFGFDGRRGRSRGGRTGRLRMAQIRRQERSGGAHHDLDALHPYDAVQRQRG